MRSLIKRVEVDEAPKTGACRENPEHPISRGERRLKVRAGRGWELYCVLCGMKMLQESVVELQRLERVLRESQAGVYVL